MTVPAAFEVRFRYRTRLAARGARAGPPAPGLDVAIAAPVPAATQCRAAHGCADFGVGVRCASGDHNGIPLRQLHKKQEDFHGREKESRYR